MAVVASRNGPFPDGRPRPATYSVPGPPSREAAQNGGVPEAIAALLGAVGALLDSRFGTWVTTLVTAVVAGAFGIW